MAAQEETDSMAGSQREDDDDDDDDDHEITNDELPDSHVTNGTVYPERHDVEMVDIAGHDEAGMFDSDPLLALNHKKVEKTSAGNICVKISTVRLAVL